MYTNINAFEGAWSRCFLPIYFSSLTFSNFIISSNVKSEIPSSQVKGFWSAALYMTPEWSGSETLDSGRWWDTCLAFICYVNKNSCHVFFTINKRHWGHTAHLRKYSKDWNKICLSDNCLFPNKIKHIPLVVPSHPRAGIKFNMNV